jgi:Xaa-Pro aminopeptidase
MFESETYIQRRTLLKKQIPSGVILFLGNEESAMNYPANTYPFRQDSSFLYFFGLDVPGLAAVIDCDSGTEVVYGNDITLEDVIWMGFLPSIGDLAQTVGVKKSAPLARLDEIIASAQGKNRKIHYLPPYRPETLTRLSSLLGKPMPEVKKGISETLIKAVVAQRSTKSEEEVREIDRALQVSRQMYRAAMEMARPGIYEHEIVGAIEGIALANGCQTAFPTILTINGHVFHNHYHGNRLEKGRLLVIDSGVSSPAGYASDITRTIPVSGRFTAKQKDIYNIVLSGQTEAIRMSGPGIKYKDVHLATARSIAAGLKDLGLMKGDPDEAVAAGAHALFFPHGLGHMLGLDVHDMEGLGENYVGYDETISRSGQFGLAYLRLARALQPGFVLTCEPGIYFVPPLIDQWEKERKFREFINYDRVEAYRDFTGVRIEDNLLIAEQGNRVLGKPIPKKASEIEKIMYPAGK